jgi:hypothetical protein
MNAPNSIFEALYNIYLSLLSATVIINLCNIWATWLRIQRLRETNHLNWKHHYFSWTNWQVPGCKWIMAQKIGWEWRNPDKNPESLSWNKSNLDVIWRSQLGWMKVKPEFYIQENWTSHIILTFYISKNENTKRLSKVQPINGLQRLKQTIQEYSSTIVLNDLSDRSKIVRTMGKIEFK